MTERVPIIPGTRIGALLDDWPELEESLLGMAPEFARLRNPVLRRTIGRVATLARAARLAGLDPVAFVNRLRKEAGLEPLASEEGTAAPLEATPAWAEAVRVSRTLDAEALLEAGENPLAVLRRAAAGLRPGEAVLLRSSFRPVPLVEALREEGGFRAAVRGAGEGYETLVARS